MPFYLYLFILFCFFSKCPDLEVINATSQKWGGGVAGTGGVYYTISIKTNKPSEKLVIDQLWVKDKFLKFKLRTITGHTGKIEFQKKDTLIISASEKIIPGFKQVKEKDNSGREKAELPEKPFEYKGAALIGYKIDEKRKYLAIEKLKRLKPINYP